MKQFTACVNKLYTIFLLAIVDAASTPANGQGQFEAARSTGLTATQAMAHVVLPQAVRNVLPDLLSNTVEVVKLTSLASVVSLAELLYSADMARSITANAGGKAASAFKSSGNPPFLAGGRLGSVGQTIACSSAWLRIAAVTLAASLSIAL